jgi:mono/diheme cytochrome c family protein
MMTRCVVTLVVATLLASVAAGCAHADRTPEDADVGNVQLGRALFETNCSTCHGATGVQGGVGPSLRGESRRKDLDATIAWIHHPQPPMPQLYPSPLTSAEVVDIASYVESL